MYKQPLYFEKGKDKDRKVNVFCTIIAIITIGIIVFTGITAYKMIKKNNSKGETTSPSTIGVGELEEKNEESKNSKNSNTTPKSSSSEERQGLRFPEHDINAAMESQLPQYSDEIAKKVVNVYFEEAKKVYLTFDDGPSILTPEVLDILKKYNVKATFFVLGSNVEKHPEIVKRAYDEGHFIANHSYSHVYSQIYSSPQATLDEYNKTLELIRKAIEVPNYNPHLFRFPGGSSGGKYDSVKKEAINLLKENGITHTNWNCLTGDAAGSNTIEAMWKELNETAQGDDNLVILMHDAGDKQTTVEFLPQLIEKYQAEGYEFCTYYDVMCE